MAWSRKWAWQYSVRMGQSGWGWQKILWGKQGNQKAYKRNAVIKHKEWQKNKKLTEHGRMRLNPFK